MAVGIARMTTPISLPCAFTPFTIISPSTWTCKGVARPRLGPGMLCSPTLLAALSCCKTWTYGNITWQRISRGVRATKSGDCPTCPT
jgi:hypothetical protein